MTIWYRIIQPLTRWGVARIVRAEVEGLHHIPRTGPCVLAPNHQSVLDPLLIQGIVPRPVDSMTKSTQYSRGFFRWILPRIHAFPVRRYRVDAQSVRVMLRKLEAGKAVCLYPEGERSWDGTLQPLRRGALRVLLRTGAPVVPVGVDGMYDVWPRWAAGPTPGLTVQIRFGAPIRLGEHRDRAEREAALPEAERRLRDALLELSGEANRRPETTDRIVLPGSRRAPRA